MKKDIEVTCGASKIDVRVNKNYFKEKRMDLRNIDQLTMSKNGTNCIPTYDRNTESYRFIIFAPFTMCNTQVVHETEGTSSNFEPFSRKTTQFRSKIGRIWAILTEKDPNAT